MPGLRAPSDYTDDPPRHPALVINSKEPFNAEPQRFDLVSSYVTPVEFFYKRNHGPIPIVDDIDKYSVTVTGLIEIPKDLYMKDIWKLPKYSITATLQCAGNRRTSMSKTRKVKGVGWDVAAIGNGRLLEEEGESLTVGGKLAEGKSNKNASLSSSLRDYRGQMGTKVKETEKVDESKLANGTTVPNSVIQPQENPIEEEKAQRSSSCCQGANGFSCCRDENTEQKQDKNKMGGLSCWTSKLEQRHVLTTVAIAGAVVTVALAYAFYKRAR